MLFMKICFRNIQYVIEDKLLKIRWQMKILKLMRIMGLVKFFSFIIKNNVRSILIYNTQVHLSAILSRKGFMGSISYDTGEIMKNLDEKSLRELLGFYA